MHRMLKHHTEPEIPPQLGPSAARCCGNYRREWVLRPKPRAKAGDQGGCTLTSDRRALPLLSGTHHAMNSVLADNERLLASTNVSQLNDRCEQCGECQNVL